jgi:hypothetical protein
MCARVHQVHLQPMHHDSETAALSLFITFKQFTQQRSKAIAGASFVIAPQSLCI